ncbi:MAG: ArsR/SmtB family transcription factor [Luteibaculaceae bacterium]
MGITKVELFTEAQNTVASFARLLSNPARVAILQYLIEANTCVNTNLVEELGLAQATISQHLAELKAAELIVGSTEGKKINYCINAAKWAEMQATFNFFLTQFPNANTCC